MIESRQEAEALLYGSATDRRRRDQRGWDLLDDDVSWRLPEIKVVPLHLAEDPAVMAAFVGQEWAAPKDDRPRRPRAGRQHGCIYWGVLRRSETAEIVIDEFSVAPIFPRRLTTTMLRALALDRILANARAAIQDQADWLNVAEGFGYELPPPAEIERIRRLADQVQWVRVRRGRRGNPPEFYRAFALEALQLQKELGITRGLRGELARRRHQEVPTIRDWLRRCRDLGYLAEAEWGKAGLRPGPRLQQEENDG